MTIALDNSLGTVQLVPQGKIARPSRRSFWALFARNRLALASAIFLLVLTAIALLAPRLPFYGPNETHVKDRLALPSPQYPFGTDHLGRDSLSRFIWGARTSLILCYTSGIMAMSIGLIVGTVAGYFGGWPDTLFMRLVDVFYAVPSFFLVLVLVALLGPSQELLILVMGFTLWPFAARMVRAETLSHRERDYVLAARCIGAKNTRILLRHIVPNTLFVVIVTAALLMAEIILLETALSYIGALNPDVPSWGRMLSEAQQYMRHSWLLPVLPGLGITLTVLAFNLAGDGLNDAISRRDSTGNH